MYSDASVVINLRMRHTLDVTTMQRKPSLRFIPSAPVDSPSTGQIESLFLPLAFLIV